MAKAKKSKAKKSAAKKKTRKVKKTAKRAKPASRRAPAKKSKKAAAPKAAPRKAKKAAAPKKKQKLVGEGDYAASRAFLKDQSSFVKKNKAKIPEMGKQAERALEGPEGDTLRAAEQEAMNRSVIE